MRLCKVSLYGTSCISNNFADVSLFGPYGKLEQGTGKVLMTSFLKMRELWLRRMITCSSLLSRVVIYSGLKSRPSWLKDFPTAAFFFFKYLFIYYYFWLCWIFVAALRFLLLRSTGSRACGLSSVVHGLNCSTACGIFPDQGSNPCPLHWLVGSYPLDHQRRPVYPFLKEDLLLQLSVFFPSDSLLIPLTLTLCSPFANYSFEGHGVSNLETKVTM